MNFATCCIVGFSFFDCRLTTFDYPFLIFFLPFLGVVPYIATLSDHIHSHAFFAINTSVHRHVLSVWFIACKSVMVMNITKILLIWGFKNNQFIYVNNLFAVVDGDQDNISLDLSHVAINKSELMSSLFHLFLWKDILKQSIITPLYTRRTITSDFLSIIVFVNSFSSCIQLKYSSLDYNRSINNT